MVTQRAPVERMEIICWMTANDQERPAKAGGGSEECENKPNAYFHGDLSFASANTYFNGDHLCYL